MLRFEQEPWSSRRNGYGYASVQLSWTSHHSLRALRFLKAPVTTRTTEVKVPVGFPVGQVQGPHHFHLALAGHDQEPGQDRGHADILAGPVQHLSQAAGRVGHQLHRVLIAHNLVGIGVVHRACKCPAQAQRHHTPPQFLDQGLLARRAHCPD
uniref:Uncharacterized protein n=1 Tax=Ixodes ricinus TaxID=34613 RepID=A0A0K8RJ46_IXORI